MHRLCGTGNSEVSEAALTFQSLSRVGSLNWCSPAGAWACRCRWEPHFAAQDCGGCVRHGQESSQQTYERHLQTSLGTPATQIRVQDAESFISEL